MIERLEQIYERYREIEEQIATLEVATDPKQLQKLAQERAGIENVATRYGEYKATSRLLAETKAMLNEDLDEEMTELVKQEAGVLESLMENMLEDLKLALLPKDDKDNRDIIMEIRAGAGGNEAGLFAARKILNP